MSCKRGLSPKQANNVFSKCKNKGTEQMYENEQYSIRNEQKSDSDLNPLNVLCLMILNYTMPILTVLK